VVPGEKVTVRGQFNKKEATLTAAKLAICAGPWASKLVNPLLTKSIYLKSLAAKSKYLKMRWF